MPISCARRESWRQRRGGRSAPFWPTGSKPSCGNERASIKLAAARSPGFAKGLISSGRRPSHATSSMSDRYFVDTNILMYAHDSAAGEKHARAKALVEVLWENRSGAVSTQVLQELAVNLRRKAKKPLDAKATRDVISDYLAWHVVVNGGDSILEALELETRYQL